MFKFDSVASNFNVHLRGQLPWYEGFLNGFLPEVASFFIRENSLVYDIGASTGNVESVLTKILKERKINFVPIEKNKEMIRNYGGIKKRILCKDVTKITFNKFSFLTSILTLSFVHPSDRSKLLNSLKEKCEVGGAILILEKFSNQGGILGTLFNRITWRNKLENKEPLVQIIEKELSLSGSQYPLSENEVSDMKLVWAYGDFKAYLYIKGATP